MLTINNDTAKITIRKYKIDGADAADAAATDIFFFETIVATLRSSFPYILILFIFIDDTKGQTVGYIIVYSEKSWVSCDDVDMIKPFKGDYQYLTLV